MRRCEKGAQIDYAPQTGDISVLAKLTNRTSLSMGLHQTSIAGFGVVAGMTKLSSLQVYAGDLADISPLTNCKSL